MEAITKEQHDRMVENLGRPVTWKRNFRDRPWKSENTGELSSLYRASIATNVYPDVKYGRTGKYAK
jgi:hypothetical protein